MDYAQHLIDPRVQAPEDGQNVLFRLYHHEEEKELVLGTFRAPVVGEDDCEGYLGTFRQFNGFGHHVWAQNRYEVDAWLPANVVVDTGAGKFPFPELKVEWMEERYQRDLDRNKKELTELRETVAGYQSSQDLRWRADSRARKRWQEAAPGRDMTWPDHADSVVFLLSQIEILEKRLTDFAEYGTRHDTNPTLLVIKGIVLEPQGSWQKYAEGMDNYVREMAKQALQEAKTPPTV